MSHSNLTVQFEKIFRHLLAGEALAQFEKGLSGLFEVVATNLLGEFESRIGCYFDGVSGMTAILTSPRKIELQGEMWVGRDRSQWTEPFRASIVDKSSTKQGICITVWVGEDRAEGDIVFALRRLGGAA